MSESNLKGFFCICGEDSSTHDWQGCMLLDTIQGYSMIFRRALRGMAQAIEDNKENSGTGNSSKSRPAG